MMNSSGNKIISNKISKCRVCSSDDVVEILDLGVHALANSLKSHLNEIEYKSPLILVLCNNCEVAQLSENVDPKRMFSNYLWVTGTSKSTINYSYEFYKNSINILNKKPNKVLEIASNDGTFLKPFKENNSQVFGIDPAKNIAEIANKKNIKTYDDFFNSSSFDKYEHSIGKVDFIFARNVLAHVPDPMDFIKGIKKFMNNKSVGAFEFHYNKKILDELHYDSIYHEHYFYYSLKNMIYMLGEHELNIFDVKQSPINSGNLVVYFSLENKEISLNVKETLQLENNDNSTLENWQLFAKNSKEHNKSFLNLIKNYKNIIGFGSSARSSTFLNFAKINDKTITCIVDNNALKQNKYTAGTNIKILSPQNINWKKHDVVLVLAWNFYDEIVKFLDDKGFKGSIIKPFPFIEKKIL
jgi:SAM-dependent methyltransferase